MATRSYKATLPAGLRAYALALGLIGLLITAAIAPLGLGAASTVDAEERLALDLVNQERADHGLPALGFSASLQAAAECMSLDQA